MVSTVVTSTVTTITSTVGFGTTLGLVAVIALAVFLCARQLAATGEGNVRKLLVASMNISIVPLIIVFAVIVVVKVVEIL